MKLTLIDLLKRFSLLTLCLLLAHLAVAQTTSAPGTEAYGQAQSGTVVLSGNVPQQVRNGSATLTGHYNPDQMLRLAIAVTPPHPDEERQFLTDVQNKQSPLFHQFLSAAEWNARFGPSVEAEQAVVDWAQSQGLTVTHHYNHRLAVDVEAQAGVIEKALHITINVYQLPAGDGLEARTVYSNDRDPVLPSSLSGVVFAVLGLNSIEVARPAGGSGRLVPRPDYVPGPVVQELDSAQKDASPDAVRALAAHAALSPEVTPPPPGYWQPTDMFSSNAYDYQALMNQGHCCNPLNNTSGHSPRESSIAIAAFGDVSLNDVAGFQQAFPYLAYYVNKIGIDGGYTCSSSSDENCSEVTMDTEWSLAMANSEGAASDTARVVVYEGSNYTNAIIMDVYNQMLADAHARTMTTSWGWGENTEFSSEGNTYNATMQSVDAVFSSMAGQGWTLIAASGDNGAVDGCQDALRVDFPSSDPNVVAAGGTTLNEGSDSSTYEVAWTGGTSSGSCLGNGGGSTGGFSEYWGVPGYQSGMGFPSRAVPDLALEATYGHDVYLNGGWAHLGGTSVVAPMLAGFFAQENAYLLAIGNKCGSAGTAACAPLGNPNPDIYEEGIRNNAGRSPFYDIVSGCNSNDITIEYNLTPYCAKPGFDEVTGWGSANMLQLAWAINWEVTAATGIPYVTFSGPATNTWYNTNQTVNWEIVDYAGGTGAPGTGIAGETQGWDSVPADPSVEPHGGSGNSFYSGPQFPNGATGCLAFEPNGCSGGVSQGCHTAKVEGWNNQGLSTGDASYGPICYDTIPPVTKASLNGTLSGSSYVNLVAVTLTATDPGHPTTGSGVASTVYQVNGGTVKTYSVPFLLASDGTNTVTFHSMDVAGNVESTKSISFSMTSTTVTTLSSSPNPAPSGKTVKFTAVVSPTLAGTPTGTVTFRNGATVLGTETLSGGAATLSTAALTLGSHSITATYNGATYFEGSASAALSEVIENATTTTLASSKNPSEYGQSITLTATVTHTGTGTPTGTVTFKAGSTTIGTGTLNSSGKATLATSTLTVATHSLTAVYGGNSSFYESTSAVLKQVVNKASSSTKVVSSLNPSASGQTVKFTATVKSSTTGTPTGTVTFKDGTTTLGSHTLSGGTAAFSTSTLAVGTHSITAVYAGNSDYATATSPALSQVVKP